MKESIGQAFILNLILFFFGILVILYFGSINYSKAYKAKNRVITTIEKYGEWNDNVRDEVFLRLQESGYQTVNTTPEELREACTKRLKNEVEIKDGGPQFVYPKDGDFSGRGYEFCVVKYCSGLGHYYQVITFMRFEVPVINGLLHPAIRGETKALYKNINDGSCNASE